MSNKKIPVRKRLDVVCSTRYGTVVVHTGEFNPDIADKYVIQINSKHARQSLVVQEVKRAVERFEDEILAQFNELPPNLKNKLADYFPIEDWEFRQHLRKIKEDVIELWKI
jgi:hypothetical protein